MSEMLVADKFIYGTLVEDTEIQSVVSDRIFSGLAPPDTGFPFIAFNLMSAQDVQIVGSNRLGSSLIFQVQVIGNESYSSLEDAVQRIDQLLHGGSGTVNGGRVISCIREEVVSRDDADDGVRYFYRGGLYRLLVQSD